MQTTRRQIPFTEQILEVMEGFDVVCIHVLVEKTGIPYKPALKATASLREQGLVERAAFPNNPEMTGYRLINRIPQKIVDPDNPEYDDSFVEDGGCSPIVGLTERDARDRLTMLQRMKDRLIVDWHPIIDVIMADYRRDLFRAELAYQLIEDEED